MGYLSYSKVYEIMADLFIKDNYCAVDFYNTNGKCTLELFNGDTVGLSKKCSKYSKVDTCTDSSKLNLSVHDYQLMMGLTANFLGFMMVFLVGFLFVLQGRR